MLGLYSRSGVRDPHQGLVAVTVGADGFSYTRKDGSPDGDRTGFKLGAQL